MTQAKDKDCGTCRAKKADPKGLSKSVPRESPIMQFARRQNPRDPEKAYEQLLALLPEGWQNDSGPHMAGNNPSDIRMNELLAAMRIPSVPLGPNAAARSGDDSSYTEMCDEPGGLGETADAVRRGIMALEQTAGKTIEKLAEVRNEKDQLDHTVGEMIAKLTTEEREKKKLGRTISKKTDELTRARDDIAKLELPAQRGENALRQSRGALNNLNEVKRDMAEYRKDLLCAYATDHLSKHKLKTHGMLVSYLEIVQDDLVRKFNEDHEGDDLPAMRLVGESTLRNDTRSLWKSHKKSL